MALIGHLTSASRGLSRPGIPPRRMACAQGFSYIDNRCLYLSPLCAGSLAGFGFFKKVEGFKVSGFGNGRSFLGAYSALNN